MGMKRAKVYGSALVGAVVSCLIAGSARGAVLAETDFVNGSAIVKNVGGVESKTGHGIGWRSSGIGGSVVSRGSLVVDLPLSGLDARKGAFDFTLVRGAGQAHDEESIFTLIGENELEPLFNLNLIWDKQKGLIRSGGLMTNETAFWTAVKGTNGKEWTKGTSIGNIGLGREFRVTVTWGPAGNDNKLYLNGVALDAKPSEEFDLAEIIKRSTKLLIGEEIGSPVDGKHGGYHSQLASTLLNFKILDTPTATEQRSILGAEITGVSHDVFKVAGFSGKLVAGNSTHVVMTGTPGSVATFDVARYADGSDRSISLDWKGYGVYLEDKPFLAESEVDLHDVEGYRVYASKAPFSAVTAEMVPVQSLKLEEQSFLLENLDLDVPYYVGVYAEMRDGSLRPVIEPRVNLSMVESAPGTYTGEFTVGQLDSYPHAVVVAHLVRGAESASLVAAGDVFAIDTAMRVQVSATPEELKADEKSTAQVRVTLTDANGNPAPGRKVRFVLATTSQYTGVVGGGAFAEQVGGAMVESSVKETDLFGVVKATYVAGFAAKTAIVVARDMVSNSTGTAVVKTFIQSAAELELLAVGPSAAADAGYAIMVTSSDEWLTADGKSQARITAKVTKGNKAVEGHDVRFTVSSGSGKVRAVRGQTGKDGEARALYTAGTKIGLVLVTATDTTVDISGSVQIELRSDAPAKIAISLDHDKIPADGSSRATLQVTVTDINDNPNENTEVEYRIASGGGKLRDNQGLTDRRGENEVVYVAGSTPGKVTIEITVRSPLPTEAEVAKARDLALLPSASEYF